MSIINEDETFRKVNYGLSTSVKRVWIASPWVSTWIIDRDISPKDAKLIVRLSDRSDYKITDFEKLKQLDDDGEWDIRCHPNLHTKMYIFDDFCIIGSSNLTSRGMGKSNQSNRETSVLLEHNEEVQDASKRFIQIWNESEPIQDIHIPLKRKQPKMRGIKDILKLFKPHDPFERIR